MSATSKRVLTNEYDWRIAACELAVVLAREVEALEKQRDAAFADLETAAALNEDMNRSVPASAASRSALKRSPAAFRRDMVVLRNIAIGGSGDVTTEEAVNLLAAMRAALAEKQRLLVALQAALKSRDDAATVAYERLEAERDDAEATYARLESERDESTADLARMRQVYDAAGAEGMVNEPPCAHLIEAERLEKRVAELETENARLLAFESRVTEACRESPGPCICGYHLSATMKGGRDE